MAGYSGFAKESFDEVFIILDKMDKIGPEGVEMELKEAGYKENVVDTYLTLFKEVTNDLEGIHYLKEKLAG